MTETKIENPCKVKLKAVRISYPKIFRAERYEDQPGTEAYSATFLIPKSDEVQMANIKKAINAAAMEKFPDPAKAKAFIERIKGSKQQWCFRDGDVYKPDDENYQGHMFLTARRKASDGAPKVYHKNPKIGGRDNLIVEADGIVYAGCYVNATVSLYAQTGTTEGMRCSLVGLQFAADGDSFGGASAASADDFEDLSEGANAPDLFEDDPLGGL